MSRIIVKVGSNVLTRADGNPNITNLSSIVDQVAMLRRDGHQVVLVSSGAVACGRSAVRPVHQLDTVARRQLFASIGQIRLINLYHSLFANYDTVIGQVLTQKENFSSRTAYLNQRSCMLTMLENDVVPIVNENDTVSLTELMFTDNDELSGLVATMLDADYLVILSNVDGIYTGDPADASSRLIREIQPGEGVHANILTTKSGFGRGGMTTKCAIARKVAEEGVTVIIARGDRPGVLTALFDKGGDVPHTTFVASERPMPAVKRWIAHSDSFAKGSVTVNAGAAASICDSAQAASLLPVGIVEVNGDWDEGDIIAVCGPDGTRIAIGRAAADSEATRRNAGQHGCAPLIHYDYMCMI